MHCKFVFEWSLQFQRFVELKLSGLKANIVLCWKKAKLSEDMGFKMIKILFLNFLENDDVNLS